MEEEEEEEEEFHIVPGGFEVSPLL